MMSGECQIKKKRKIEREKIRKIKIKKIRKGNKNRRKLDPDNI